MSDAFGLPVIKLGCLRNKPRLNSECGCVPQTSKVFRGVCALQTRAEINCMLKELALRGLCLISG